MSEKLARIFHEIYERLAPQFGYETRTDTREFDPTTPNGKLMIAVTDEIERDLDARIAGLEKTLEIYRDGKRLVEANGSLLKRIGELETYAKKLLADETRIWVCSECDFEGSWRYQGKEMLSDEIETMDCPCCEKGVLRPKALVLQERIAELEAELKELQDDFVSSQNMLGGAVLEIERRANNVRELEAAQRWIPVGERLPEVKEDCLFLCFIDGVSRRFVDARTWFADAKMFTSSNVTHWMPLQQPPEEEC